MTRDQLRYHLLEGIDRILSRWRLIGLSDREKDILHAQYALFSTDDDVLDRILRRLPERSDTPDTPPEAP